MHTIKAQTNWHSHTEIKHWIKHALIPLTLIVVFLWLPKPWNLTLFQPNSVIEIELIEIEQTIPVKHILDAKTIQQPLKEPAIEAPIEAPPKNEVKTVEALPNEVAKIEIKTQSIPQETITIKQTLKINATDVMQMIKDRTSIDIPIEFQARVGPATDFYIPKQEIQDWLADIPFLDESIDKPKLQMKFYAEGIEGSIEKFFDKITISKTFTTKYGTKIHCALIGVIAACGWK